MSFVIDSRMLGSSLLALVLVGVGEQARAQSDPCADCLLPELLVYPEAGIWRNPEQSGTGFMFEVQNGRLGGYYYLYDEQGHPIWYALTGELQRPDTPDVIWELETELIQYEHGACLNCDHSPPEVGGSPGVIHLEFTHRNLARFSVEGGTVQEIMPLTYGVSGQRPFPAHEHQVLPDLSGPWLIVLSAHDQNGTRGAVRPEYVTLVREPGAGIRYQAQRPSFFYPGMVLSPPPPPLGSMECAPSDSEGLPVCRFLTGANEPVEFILHAANISSRRFVGRAANAHHIEGFRVDFD